MAATWGFGVWSGNAWGSDNNINAVSGISASFSLGGVTVDAELNSGWGRVEWGNFSWGDAYSAQATGIGLTATLDDVLISTDVNADVTGESLSLFLGNENINIATEVFPSGFDINSNIGSVSFTITGSVSLSGEPATANLGTATLDANTLVDVTGQSITTSLGDESITGTANISLSGELLSANEGTANLDANTIVEVTTEVTPGWGATVGWGQQQWGQASVEMSMSMNEGTVDPSPDAEVTGIGFSASLAVGTVVIGEANVTVVGEGFGAALGVGNLDAVTLADVSGIAMSANIGTLSAKGFANVFPTGIGLTMTVGTNRTLVWNQVNTGTAPTWTEVDTAA